MTNRVVEYLTFNFPELLFVNLACILLLGQYTGYRLTELRRFQPITDDALPVTDNKPANSDNDVHKP